jgi:flagellar biosynthesis/type III secretory pathway M-ring protein FliF/YscJ
MDFLKAPLQRIPDQLKGLTLSQRMLAGSLVTIMILTMLLWGHYASTADMEPVVGDSVGGDTGAAMADALQRHGIESKIVGDKLYVAADQKQEALTWLMWERKMPADSTDGFDKIFKEMSPFDTGSRDDALFNEGKQVTLSQLIGGFPHVQFAKVVIDGKQERTIGGSPDPVAYVNIVTDGTPDAQAEESRLVQSAGYAVVGSQRGLKLQNVTFTVDGIPKRAHDPEDGIGDDVYKEIANEETRQQDKLSVQLAYLQKPLIEVSVDKSLQSGHEDRVQYNGVLSKEKDIQSKTDDTTTSAPPSGEAGAVPNTSLSIAPAAGAGGSSTNSETDDTTFENFPSVTHSEVNQPVARATVTSVSVDIPRSYLVMLYHKRQPDSGTQNPDDVALAPLLKDESEKARNLAMKCTGLKSAADIYVTDYDDEIQAPASGAMDTASAVHGPSAVSSLLGAHGRELGIGALAAISLFMVTMMARKGGAAVPNPVHAAAMSAYADAKAEEAAVAVGASENALEAVELDDEAMKAQQVVEQVSTMVKQDPDAAAAMIKRWLNRA